MNQLVNVVCLDKGVMRKKVEELPFIFPTAASAKWEIRKGDQYGKL